MKRIILLAVALLVASTASADNIVNTGVRFENLKNGQITDANGNAKTLEALKDRDYTLAGDIVNSNLAAQGSDSSGVVPIGDIRRLSIFLRPTLVGGKRVRLAVEIRLHKAATADSVSTSLWSPDLCFSQNFRLNAQGIADSVGDVGTLPTVWESAQPGEIMVTWDPLRGSPSNSVASPAQFPAAKSLNIECLGGAKWFSIRVRNCSANVIVPVVISYTGSPL